MGVNVRGDTPLCRAMRYAKHHPTQIFFYFFSTSKTVIFCLVEVRCLECEIWWLLEVCAWVLVDSAVGVVGLCWRSSMLGYGLVWLVRYLLVYY